MMMTAINPMRRLVLGERRRSVSLCLIYLTELIKCEYMPAAAPCYWGICSKGLAKAFTTVKVIQEGGTSPKFEEQSLSVYGVTSQIGALCPPRMI